MNFKTTTLLVLFAIMTTLMGAPASAEDLVTVEETWSINTGLFIDRLDQFLAADVFDDDREIIETFRGMFGLLGLYALESTSGEFVLKNGQLLMTKELSLKAGADPGYFGELLALPDRDLNPGKLIDPESALLAVSIANPVEKLEIMWSALQDEELQADLQTLVPELGAGMFEIALAEPGSMIEHIGGFTRIKEIIGDEIHLLVYDMPAEFYDMIDFNPWGFTVLAAIEIDDFAGLDELSGGMINSLRNSGEAIKLGTLDFYGLTGSLFLGINDEFLVFAINPQDLAELFAAPGDPGDPQTSCLRASVNIDRIWRNIVSPAFDAMMTDEEVEEILAASQVLWGFGDDTDFGMLDITCRTGDTSLSTTIEGSSALTDLYGYAVFSAMIPSYFATKLKAQETVVKSELHAIQLAMERYAVDNGGFYPEDLQVLLDEGYLTAFPGNPLNDDLPMRQVADGEFSPGDFVYIPEYHDGGITGYTLKAFGADEYGGIDYNGVIIELSTGPWDEETGAEMMPDVGNV